MAKMKIREERIDSFVIPISTIEKMNELNYKTGQHGKEYSMTLCMDNKEKQIVPGNIAKGNELGVYIDPKCNVKKNQTFIGNFHTHPNDSETKFSAADLVAACDIRNHIDCVGMDNAGNIVCYMKKDKNKACGKESEPLKAVEDLYGEFEDDEIPNALLNTVDRLVDRKFISKKIL